MAAVAVGAAGAVDLVVDYRTDEFPHNFLGGQHFQHMPIIGAGEHPVTVGQFLRAGLVGGVKAP